MREKNYKQKEVIDLKVVLFLLDMLPFIALIAMVWIFGKLIFGETEYEDYEDPKDDCRRH